MDNVDHDRSALADYLGARRNTILEAWRNAIRKDPALTTSDSLPKVDLYDHIPALLADFERALRKSQTDAKLSNDDVGRAPAAAHGLECWQQGYDLREVTRELGKLNEIVVAELEEYLSANPAPARAARRLWAALSGTCMEESVNQYFQLQRQEAAGHLKDLESALQETRQLERQRGDLWRQAAHDLRGNLGVVANATVGLTEGGLRGESRETFVRILMRNVTSLHHLLNDVTDFARLQAGSEQLRVEPLDISPILQQLCEGIRPLAQQYRLFLRCDGPPGFAVEGDEVKIRRIAQNLILNAVKFTRNGGITVSWGDSSAMDPKRWELCIKDTGPGFRSGSGQSLAQALEKAHDQSVTVNKAHADEKMRPNSVAPENLYSDMDAAGAAAVPGEGLGLSIVKRLCEILNATIEMSSATGIGTTFRILFPRRYLS